MRLCSVGLEDEESGARLVNLRMLRAGWVTGRARGLPGPDEMEPGSWLGGSAGGLGCGGFVIVVLGVTGLVLWMV